MKLLGFIVLICIWMEGGSSQPQQQQIENLEKQLQILQSQVDHQFQYLKKKYFETVPKSGKLKNMYLSMRGNNDSVRIEIHKEIMENFDEKMYKRFENINPQMVKDYKEFFSKIFDEAIHSMNDRIFNLFDPPSGVKILNVTKIQQRQERILRDKGGQLEYEFFRADYNECLELLAMDLSKYLSLDAVSRIISLHRMLYGNRTEIETALSYLYVHAPASTIGSVMDGTSTSH
ncbi:uncharacterized protein LOC129570385 [Sitodiplosis mosellana]|uniref:uncharacterized protein LOC129570385 n=1 Tax=Sitodiplosis mosellana TaxID=263140 RepID=UPI002443BBEC|nr:uncharacterized protein LOC129570385 [Sitodiplosis mosellana]